MSLPRQSHNLSNTLSASLAGLEEVERHLARNEAAAATAASSSSSNGDVSGSGSAARAAAPGASPAAAANYVAYLKEARGFFQDDVAANIRFGSLLKVWKA